MRCRLTRIAWGWFIVVTFSTIQRRRVPSRPSTATSSLCRRRTISCEISLNFFTRPNRKLFGIGLYGSENYDACTSAYLNLFWSFDAELWNPKTNKAQGYINSPEAKKALDFFKGLFVYAPPGFQNAYVPELNKAVKAGQVAMGDSVVLFL